jgi:hypothetical protein
MASNILQRISIPKPCHEDWNKMTPDQKGAFCGVCNKSVHDFSMKNAEEIERILLSEAEGKICGRFSKAQLDVPKDVEIPLHLLPRNLSPFRAFALAVFLIFGTAMFGLTNVFGQGHEKMQGKVCIRRTTPDKTEQNNTTVKGDVKAEKAPEKVIMVAGGVKFTAQQTEESAIDQESSKGMRQGEVSFRINPITDSLEKQVTEVKRIETLPADTSAGSLSENHPLDPLNPLEPLNTELLVTGQTMFTTESKKVSPVLDFVLGDTIISGKLIYGSVPPAQHSESYVLGGLSLAVIPEPPVILIPSEQENVLVTDPVIVKTLPGDHVPKSDQGNVLREEESSPVFTCFPNPTNGLTNLNYTLSKRADVSAEVYNSEGKLVKTLFNVSKQYEGIYQNGIDLSELANGIYIIRLRIGDNRLNTRVLLSK